MLKDHFLNFKKAIQTSKDNPKPYEELLNVTLVSYLLDDRFTGFSTMVAECIKYNR